MDKSHDINNNNNTNNHDNVAKFRILHGTWQLDAATVTSDLRFKPGLPMFVGVFSTFQSSSLFIYA